MLIHLSKDLLIKEYLDSKLNSYEIAKKYNRSATWVNILRKRYGIKTLRPYERNPKQELSERQREYIYGTLLGDGCIIFDKRKPNKNAFLRVCQSESHVKYVEFQFSIMKDFAKRGVGIYLEKRSNRQNMCCFRTISHPIFTKIYREIYPAGIKRISDEWLSQLTPFSLAIWHMDDGSITQSNHRTRISTESFSHKEHLLIQRYLKQKWDILVGIRSSPCPGKFLLLFRAEERDKFFTLIEPYIIPEMRYKLYNKEREWKKWTSTEIKFLKQNYLSQKTDWAKIINFLKHSREAIYRKASYLNLTN